MFVEGNSKIRPTASTKAMSYPVAFGMTLGAQKFGLKGNVFSDHKTGLIPFDPKIGITNLQYVATANNLLKWLEPMIELLTGTYDYTDNIASTQDQAKYSEQYHHHLRDCCEIKNF